MSLEELLRRDEIVRTKPDKKTAERNLKLAERDLKSATGVFQKDDYDWSLAIAYNAMLQAARAFMFPKGYRPKGPHKHVVVVHFIACFKQVFDSTSVALFDKIRKRRHIAVYELPKTVSKSEAERALANAKTFVEKVKLDV